MKRTGLVFMRFGRKRRSLGSVHRGSGPIRTSDVSDRSATSLARIGEKGTDPNERRFRSVGNVACKFRPKFRMYLYFTN